MYVCIYVCTYVMRPNYPTHTAYYVLAAVFASYFYVLKNLTARARTYYYYILAAVFALYLNFALQHRTPNVNP